MPILPPPPPGGRTSIKQAKANFKARNHNPLSEKEKRQLDRAAELERRAWRARESEKRKSEATRRREDSKLQREKVEKLLLGSQRRCDKFGYKSSQMHLGAFFGAGAGKNLETPRRDSTPIDVATDINEDDFGDSDFDDDFDDDALQGALDGASDAKPRTPVVNFVDLPESVAEIMQPRPVPAAVHIEEDLESLWDELDSSTQIARDLEDRSVDDKVSNEPVPPQTRSSFGSEDFDISVEEIEAYLAPTVPAISKAHEDSKLMPPPKLQIKHNPKPPLCISPVQSGPTARKITIVQNEENHAMDLDLTLSQLDSLVESDIQLTQMDPG